MIQGLSTATREFNLGRPGEEENTGDEPAFQREVGNGLGDMFGTFGRGLLSRLSEMNQQLAGRQPGNAGPAEIGLLFKLQEAAPRLNSLNDLPEGILHPPEKFTVCHPASSKNLAIIC
jgi:hypothetical protein